MKKVTFMLASAVLAVLLSSCYRHTVCATYTNDIKIEKSVDADENI